MVNHARLARFFPLAYEGSVNRPGSKSQSIIEVATYRELPPILCRHGDWIVTTEGMDRLSHNYFIEKNRLDEDDWVSHVEEKTGVDMGDFVAALNDARELVAAGVIVVPHVPA